MTRSNHAQRRRRREDRKGECDCSQLRSAEAEAEASLKSRSEHLAGLDLDLLLVLRERATRDFARRLRIEGLKPGSSESESESEGGWRSCSRGRCGVNESLFSRFPAGSTAQCRQGKVRLTKWYSPYTQKERTKVIRELSGVILSRGPKLCNFVEWRGLKVIYKRYASLYFCMCIDADDNELETLEIIHHFVEILDRYFGNVCELDLIFNFHKVSVQVLSVHGSQYRLYHETFEVWQLAEAYYILDEVLIAGELQESSKKSVARVIAAQDTLIENAKEQAGSLSNMIAQATK
ncbi:hypothetical protein AXG93_1712s1030 [Marchantia polymorpha subsp. ruderalis]|uniref:Adaptor AP-1 19 kDa protein n=1 Tax=Marchantia polymorpha subsp. ruderalis TaxID=1480154 RepID=A0A176W0E6_MARPO|nr:hypothetical protein AXG93_1712s1030 [Marchantia polymorpha subsp. ruderalis]